MTYRYAKRDDRGLVKVKFIICICRREHLNSVEMTCDYIRRNSDTIPEWDAVLHTYQVCVTKEAMAIVT